MPRKKKVQKDRPQVIVDVGWYTREEWEKVRRIAADPDQ